MTDGCPHCKASPEDQGVVLTFHVLERAWIWVTIRRVEWRLRRHAQRHALKMERRSYHRGWRRAVEWRASTAKRPSRLLDGWTKTG